MKKTPNRSYKIYIALNIKGVTGVAIKKQANTSY